MLISFGQRLQTAVLKKGNSVCVGLDPRADLLPEPLDATANCDSIAKAYEKFCCQIIDTVGELVPVVKPQAAFFEALGPAGCVALANVNRHAQQAGLIVIMDAKRGDIGSTAEAYAAAYLTGERSPWYCDALTVNPFLGDDTLAPMVTECQRSGTGIFVLVKTSNQGSHFIQQAKVNSGDVSQQIAGWIRGQNEDELVNSALTFGCTGAVVGATYPQQLEQLRAEIPNGWLLIPGYGAQGGTATDIAAAWNSNGLGAIVNSSRGIIFAYRNKDFIGHDWQNGVRDATRRMIADLQ